MEIRELMHSLCNFSPECSYFDFDFSQRMQKYYFNFQLKIASV